MTAGSLCSRVVVTASPGESVRIAARRMAEQDVGTLVVVETDAPARAIGMLTDRDITIRCIARDGDPDTMPVAKVMSTPVQTVGEDAAIEDVVSKMAVAGTRRLVVTGRDHAMVGMLSLDDVLDLLSLDAHSIGRLVEKQNPRVPM
jgi:signal-transduction protein with cAMP-binding, CBS, and nucleotidyltransferase domain